MPRTLAQRRKAMPLKHAWATFCTRDRCGRFWRKGIARSFGSKGYQEGRCYASVMLPLDVFARRIRSSPLVLGSVRTIRMQCQSMTSTVLRKNPARCGLPEKRSSLAPRPFNRERERSQVQGYRLDPLLRCERVQVGTEAVAVCFRASTSADEACVVEAGLSSKIFRAWPSISACNLRFEKRIRRDFFEDTALDSGLTPAQERKISNPRSKLVNRFRSQTMTLKVVAGDSFRAWLYGWCRRVDELCAREAKRVGLSVTCMSQCRQIHSSLSSVVSSLSTRH